MMMNELRLPYPLSVNRYWRHFRGVTVLSREGRVFKKAVAAMASTAGVRPLSGELRLHVLILPKMTKGGEAFRRVIDVDNGLKCVLDALQGVVYLDDAQVKSLRVDYGEPVADGGCVVWWEGLA